MPLYTSCGKYTKLSAIVRLFNLKANNGWSDKSFTEMLEIFKNMLPEDNVLPNRAHTANKIIKRLDMEYEKIYACPNDGILYRKEHAELTRCLFCDEWRYKNKVGIPAKVLWYFPIIPRLRRLFDNKHDAKMLTWYAFGKSADGKLRHPSDGEQWKSFDKKYPDFGKDTISICFSLSTYGMTPFGSYNNTPYSVWPFVTAVYNLPTHLCMKRKYLMTSLLIYGPKEPENDIDIYLAPLIDDLKLLWETGVEVFDAISKKKFNLKVMLLCTITDFPAYGNIIGHSVGEAFACPLCGEFMKLRYLHHSHKTCFLGGRQFLDDLNHPYRSK